MATKYQGKKTNKRAYKYALLGLTDAQIAELLGVTETTINNWKRAHPEFKELLSKGKDLADAEVAASLFKRAKGFTKAQVKIFQFQGAPVIVDYKHYYPPDTAAAYIWLKNRKPDLWRKEDRNADAVTDLSELAAALRESYTSKY